MTTDAARLVRMLAAGLRPDPHLSTSEWADRYRRLTTETAAQAGPWRTDIVPYLREIMDCMRPGSGWRRVVVMKGAQLGGTQALNNAIGLCIQCAPGPVMVVHPTVEAVQDWSRGELTTMIEETPELRALVADPKGRDGDNTLLKKRYPGGSILMRGANSPVGLRRVSIRTMILDDVDGFPAVVGDEGDPVELCKRRLRTWGTAGQMIMVSTPTIKGSSRIERAYLDGDQRVYDVPCPHCGELQPIEWQREDGTRGIVWPRERPEEARMECRACSHLIDDATSKAAMLLGGRWRATAESDGHSASFHLPAQYAPHEWYSWAQMATDWLASYKDPARLQVFVNTQLAQTWDQLGGDGLQADRLLARVEQWEEGAPVAEQIGILTAGVDVQDDRLELLVVGWAVGEESWSIERHKLWGDPSGRRVWETLDAELLRPRAHADGGTIAISAACVDTGGHHTHSAYEFCAPRQARHVYAIVGRAGSRPIWPRRPTVSTARKVPLYTVGVDAAKEHIYGRLRGDAPGPGYTHFGPHCDVTYFDELTAERMRPVGIKGTERYEWVLPPGRRNEALDLHVYAYAALLSEMARGRTIESAADARRSDGRMPMPQERSAARADRPAPTERYARSRVARARGGQW